MPVQIIDWYTASLIEENPDTIFIFGDNDQRRGLGGQAKVCRGKPNCIGIRTKKAPLLGEDVYYTDKEFGENVMKIGDDFRIIWDFLRKGKLVCFPAQGIGTGLSELQIRAPLTLKFITEMIEITRRNF